MIITIDGPTASGKSTVAQLLAQKLGFYYLPTGWLYRAVAYLLVEKSQYTEKMLEAPKKKDITYCLDPNRLVYNYDELHGGRLFFENNDITHYLKDVTVDRTVAIISPIPMVRELVAEAQRHFAKHHDTVIEGRDSGSVVFPHAHYKFYLTASLKIRAQRWMHDQAKRGNSFTLEQAEKEIAYRDKRDMERKNSPLKVPQGAVVIDNSTLNLEQTVVAFLSVINQ